MELCSEFRATPEGIRGYGFWDCFIELWQKSMKIMGLCTVYSVVMHIWAAGGSILVFNYARMTNGIVMNEMV